MDSLFWLSCLIHWYEILTYIDKYTSRYYQCNGILFYIYLSQRRSFANSLATLSLHSIADVCLFSTLFNHTASGILSSLRHRPHSIESCVTLTSDIGNPTGNLEHPNGFNFATFEIKHSSEVKEVNLKHKINSLENYFKIYR